MTGYDRKTLSLSHAADTEVGMRVEVDITGNGDLYPYRRFAVPPQGGVSHEFPEAFGACWLRVSAEADCRATAWLENE